MGFFLSWATTPVFVYVFISCLNSADSAVPNRRQVLPPIPGYIPVYIQHGDVPPEDPHEFAGIFQVADKNVPPRVSPTIDFPTTTTEMKADTEVTEQPNLVPEVDDTNAASGETERNQSCSKSEIASNAVPEDSDGKKVSSDDKVSENKVGSPDNDISELETEKVSETLLEDSVEKNKESIKDTMVAEESVKEDKEVSEVKDAL
ncbi:uncharacterized protein [Periplaneta americana]|uniref:uncharacterized protein isoform X1 n=1 Tax=Periplaneta americana TaxID=6978 RepID=UPI0037E7A661